MRKMAADPRIRGFTTNPTLMKAAGVTDYEGFAREALAVVTDRPISFEVLSDEFDEMERQARLISQWGVNVNVKIPITNGRGETAIPLVRRLATDGIRVNVTAVMTLEQVSQATAALADGPHSFVSIFAGRIADTGRDPIPTIVAAVEIMRAHPRIETIWASPRELLNLFQADAAGCHVITMTPELLSKLDLVDKDLERFSLETVCMFRDDAARAGLRLPSRDARLGPPSKD